MHALIVVSHFFDAIRVVCFPIQITAAAEIDFGVDGRHLLCALLEELVNKNAEYFFVRLLLLEAIC